MEGVCDSSGARKGTTKPSVDGEGGTEGTGEEAEGGKGGTEEVGVIDCVIPLGRIPRGPTEERKKELTWA